VKSKIEGLNVSSKTAGAVRNEVKQPTITRVQARDILSQKIKDRVATGEINNRQARIAQIYLLNSPLLQLTNNTKEIQRVLQCTEWEVRNAIARGMEEVSKRSEFGVLMGTIQKKMEPIRNASIPITESKNQKELPKNKLSRIARAIFNADPRQLRGNKLKTQQRLASWAIVLIACQSLNKTLPEAAELAGLEVSSVSEMLPSGREEYSPKGDFYEKVQTICKELGIPAPETPATAA